eukprot:1156706-Pelagomonas_calceolata.AAC.2
MYCQISKIERLDRDLKTFSNWPGHGQPPGTTLLLKWITLEADFQASAQKQGGIPRLSACFPSSTAFYRRRASVSFIGPSQLHFWAQGPSCDSGYCVLLFLDCHSIGCQVKQFLELLTVTSAARAMRLLEPCSIQAKTAHTLKDLLAHE